ncbi:MAG: DUF3179 domain-containing protein, partial [Acidimicrobiia bacterium]|nr:DUF3179 domain-containing protein [Acidimicrobiia bacterium]
MSRSTIAIASGTAIIAAVILALTLGGGSSDPTASDQTTTTSASEDAGETDPLETDPVDPIPGFDRSLLPGDLDAVSADWATDFSRTTIDYGELLIGIRALPIRDRIPPIDNPSFVTVSEADHADEREPGLALEIDGDARFYPLSILTAHEIVNDVVGEQPVAVTFCPLCNSAIVFDRVFEDAELRFGVSGLLRNSDLVMWDNRTESLWQQLTGEGLVGEYAGEQLTFVPSSISNFGDYARR